MTDFPRSNRQKKFDGKVYQKRPLIVYLLNDRVVSGVKFTILGDILSSEGIKELGIQDSCNCAL